MAAQRRRAFLATVAAAGVAGCRTTESDSSPTATESEPATTTSVPTPTEPARIDSEWPMPAHDAGLTNATDAAGPTAPVGRLWTVETDDTPFQPILVDGVLYTVTTDGTLTALDARTGNEQWMISTDATATGTPWYAGDQLYVPREEDIAAFTSDGTAQWQTATPDRAGLVTAADGLYYAAADPPAVVALDTDGTRRWRTEIDDPWRSRLFATAERVLVSSGTRDSRYWTLDATSGDILGPEPRPGHDFPTELCYRDGTVYAVDPFFGGIDATAATDAGHSWDAGAPGGGKPTMSVTAETLYYAVNSPDSPTVLAVDSATGTERWRRPLDGEIDGRVVAGTAGAFVPTTEGTVCLAEDDGTRRWSESDLTAPLTIADDLLFTATNEGVQAFRAR